MKVYFYGNVRDYTRGEKMAEPDCANIRELVSALGKKFGKRFEDFLLGDKTCFFLVNGKGVMMTGGLDTRLGPDDRVEILLFADAG